MFLVSVQGALHGVVLCVTMCGYSSLLQWMTCIAGTVT